MLQGDRVRVNGATERDAKREVDPEDRVEIGGKAVKMVDPRVKVLYEDADLIVVDKANNILTVPSDKVKLETVESFLDDYLGGSPTDQRVHHVHRLDRDTSGVLVFAKNTWTRDRLKVLFAEHDIERVYVAIVHGKLRPPNGTFRSFLAEDRELKMRKVSDPEQGKEAVTHYRTTASGKRFSILEVTLETGRRNQIRVHLADAGHPVVGDTMYGKGVDESLRRLGLHARDLGFVHPRTKKKVVFTADVPKVFRELEL